MSLGFGPRVGISGEGRARSPAFSPGDRGRWPGARGEEERSIPPRLDPQCCRHWTSPRPAPRVRGTGPESSLLWGCQTPREVTDHAWFEQWPGEESA
ncbi:hypothetical protein NN561_016977 [Cricetulus griseus]